MLRLFFFFFPLPLLWPCTIYKWAKLSPGHCCNASGLWNLSSSETHQWGEGRMAWESDGSCLEGSQGNRVSWRSIRRHVLKEQLRHSFTFTSQSHCCCSRDREESEIKQEFQSLKFLCRDKWHGDAVWHSCSLSCWCSALLIPSRASSKEQSTMEMHPCQARSALLSNFLSPANCEECLTFLICHWSFVAHYSAWHESELH